MKIDKGKSLVRKLRVLVVEADTPIRQANVRVLAHSGCVVETVNDGEAGWDALQVKAFGLLITDHELPRLSGLNLVKRVRFAHLHLPIILTASLMPAKELARHPWLQLAAILRKPFSAAQLLATVHTAMRAPKISRKPDNCFPLRVLQEAVPLGGEAPLAPARIRGVINLLMAIDHLRR